MSVSRLDDATRATIAARFGRFITGCLVPMLVWTLALAWADAGNGWAALATLAWQTVVLAVAWNGIRRDRERRHTVAIVIGAALLVTASAVALFVWAGSTGEVLGFELFTTCAIAALVFPWGWRREAVLTAAVLGLLALGTPWIRYALHPSELVPVIAIAAILCVAIAEGHARNFRATRRRQWSEEEARRELATSRDTYRDITENARDFIWASDLDGRLTYVNETGARILGLTPAELLGRNVDEHISPPQPNGSSAAALRAHLAGGGVLPPTVLEWHSPSGHLWMEIVAYAVRGPDGAVIGFRGISRDITERWLAETALRESEARLRLMGARQTAIREEERKRLGFDLHDGVCQELVGIGILVESARQRGVSASAGATLGTVQKYLRAVGEHLRLLARELRPLQLSDLGLGECLRSLAQGMVTNGTAITVGVPPVLPRLPEEVEVAVYRVAQEALANAVRHADARRIALTLATTNDTLVLEVRDDGRGFDRDALRSRALGLVAMEERAAALGGRLAVRSLPNAGTTVRLECPIVDEIAEAG